MRRAGLTTSPAAQFPIAALLDVLTEDVIRAHLAALLPERVRELYGPLLPPLDAPTAENILRVVRSGFFHQANKELSNTVAENGVGQILATSFGYEYEGEGLEAFLRGLRRSQ